MRLLHVVPSYYPATRYGGPIRSVHGLCTALVKQGHEVHVFTTNVDGDGDSDVPMECPVDLDGVKVWYFPSKRLRRLYWSPNMMKALKREVPCFDIVHLHSVFLWPTWAAARVGRAFHVPYVLTPRGMLDRRLINSRSRWLKTAWISLIERSNLAQAACVHLTTESERTAYLELELPDHSIQIVPNGIEIKRQDESDSAKQFAPPDKPYALFLGRINWKKGADLLVRSWVDVPDWDLVIAGNDEENLQPQLEQLAEELGLNDRIHFIGTVPDENKWGLYQRARVFLLPSISENFGNTVLEAMSVACPVVVSPGVGLSAAVAKHECGLVVKRDEKEIARAIGLLQSDETLRLAMGARGREAARQHFSWDAVARKTGEIYQQVLDSTAEKVAV